MRERSDWPIVHYSAWSGQSFCGLELRVELDHALTPIDREAIDESMNLLRKTLLAQSTRLHPENVAWKADWLKRAREVFVAADLAPIHVREIDNEYCGPLCCPHRVWLYVTTRVGPIKVGWRKRVIVVDWTPSDVEATAYDLFCFEETTKGHKDIHAHGYEKMAEYLARIGGTTLTVPSV